MVALLGPMTSATLTDDDITAAIERAATRLRAGGPAQRLTLMPSHPRAAGGSDQSAAAANLAASLGVVRPDESVALS